MQQGSLIMYAGQFGVETEAGFEALREGQQIELLIDGEWCKVSCKQQGGKIRPQVTAQQGFLGRWCRSLSK